MIGILTEDRANIIANAILDDGNGCGSRGWLDRHFISTEELREFLKLPAEYVRAAAYAARAEMEFSTHKGKVGSDVEMWSVAIPHKYTDAVLAVAASGTVTALLVPNDFADEFVDQMSLPFDPDTGEVLC